MKSDITVLGAGAFGSSLAMTWAKMGRQVCLWARDSRLVEGINATRINQKYWPNDPLPHNIYASDNLDEACTASRCIIYACPSKEYANLLERMRPTLLKHSPLFVDTSKGLDPKSYKLHHQVAEEILGVDFVEKNYLCMSGPSFAAELMKGAPTCVTLSAKSSVTAKKAQDLLGGPVFRTLTSTDLIACELGGAMKNVLAICVGVAEGMNFGLNTQAALITRGLAEIVRLGVALGARPETFLGLSGLGDLVLTCTGSLSRNRSFGILLGKGDSVEEAKQKINSTIEGIEATRAVYQLIKKHGAELPLCEQAYEIIFNAKSLQQAFADILSRPLRDEWRTE